MFVLKTNRLKVCVSEPHVAPDTTSRFDHAGFVTSIVLDGTHEFCTSEPTNLVHPSTGGMGLCNEYLFPEACDEVAPGERFPKFGIGLFVKPDAEPFCFYRKYESEYFPVQCISGAQELRFVTEPLLCRGYALRQIKTLRVQDNELSMEVCLENTGERPLRMREFCHNFVTIDHLPIGPDYTIEIPALAVQPSGNIVGTICGCGHGYSFSEYNPRAALLHVASDQLAVTDSFRWTIRNAKSPATIQVCENFKPDGLDLWSIDHIISIESFYPIHLAPGESTAWTRRWRFTDQNDD